jgi:hypothetical protein
VYCIVLQHLYPELGVELPERQYGTDCRLYIPGQGINWQVGWLGGKGCCHWLPRNAFGCLGSHAACKQLTTAG